MMLPSNSPNNSKVSFLFLQSGLPKNGTTQGELFLMKPDGSLISINAELHTKQKKWGLETIVIESMGIKMQSTLQLMLLKQRKNLQKIFRLLIQLVIQLEKINHLPQLIT